MRQLLLPTALAAAALFQTSDAAMGFDLPGPIDATTCNCLVQSAGMSFAIIRGWHSYGAFDSAVVSTMSNLWAAGISHADTYMFPCQSINAALQVDWFLGNLTANGVQYGMVWLDIEQNPSTGCFWSSNLASNCNYMAALGDRLNYHGVNWGVYSTPWEWEQVMGGSACTNPVFNAQPMWYANPDNAPNFDDWTPFGGWTTPAIKQFDWYAAPCGGLTIDSDWYPDAALEAARANMRLRGRNRTATA